MAVDGGRRGGSLGGIGLGGILVIVGIVVAVVWSLGSESSSRWSG